MAALPAYGLELDVYLAHAYPGGFASRRAFTGRQHHPEHRGQHGQVPMSSTRIESPWVQRFAVQLCKSQPASGMSGRAPNSRHPRGIRKAARCAAEHTYKVPRNLTKIDAPAI